MNDHELDRLVASATHVRDGWVDGFDLRAAEDELLEEIMATPDTDLPGPLASAPPPNGSGPPPETEIPPPFASARRPRRLRLAVAIGAAAALVVGVVLVRSIEGDGSDGSPSDVGTSGEPTMQPMIADPVPEGTEVSTVYPTEGTEPSGPVEEGIDTVMFGHVTETALHDDVVIFIVPTTPEGEIVGGSPVTVRGQEGTVSGETGDLSLSWTEPSGVYLTVNSHTFDREQVVAIAEGLVVDGMTIELGAMPEGVTKPPKVAELRHLQSSGYSVDYIAPGGTGPSFHVTTRLVDQDDRMYELWLRGPRDDGQVQGHDLGLVDEGGGVIDLTWEPVPGQVVEILAQGVDEAAARAFAETLRPATDAEWTALQEQVASRPPDEPLMDPPPADAAHRELANGAEIWGWMGDDGLCYEARYPEGGGGQLCHGDPATPALGVSPSYTNDVLVSTVPAVVGVAPESSESVDGGEVTFGEEVDGGRVFVWESDVEGELPPDTLTFRDADGNEIDTVDVVTF